MAPRSPWAVLATAGLAAWCAALVWAVYRRHQARRRALRGDAGAGARHLHRPRRARDAAPAEGHVPPAARR